MIERRTIDGAINCDDAAEFIGKGDYLNMHNMRVTRDSAGRGMAGKPVAGTQQRSTDAATGTKQTIGSITDEVKGRIYRINYNSLGTHKIIAWDRKTNTTYTILQESNVTGGLGLLSAYQITGIALIGDYLYFTDNQRQQRRIDVERGIRTNHPTYVSQNGDVPVPYTLPLEQWDITVARRVPMYPPKARKLISADESDIEDRQTNLIQFNSFQFAYRYVYSTGEYSTVGPYSQVVPPNISRYLFASGYNDERAYDTIRVELDKDEPIDPEVRIVEILVRRGNTGPWNIIKTFDRTVDSALYVDHNTYGSDALGIYFFNEITGTAIPDSESYLPYFDVPLLSNALEIADNRLFLGNNEKGYDYIYNSDIELELINLGAATPELWRVTGAYYLIEWQCGTGLAEVVVMRIRDAFGAFAGWYETPYTSADFNSNSLDLNPAAEAYTRYPIMDSDEIPTELIQYLNPTCQTWTITPYTAGPDNVVIDEDWEHFVNAARAFREGYTYKVQTIFYDFAGRNAGMTHESAEVTIPGPKYQQDFFTTGIRWTLDSSPSAVPLWAHSYAIARSRVIEPFLAGYADIVRYGDRQADGSYDLTETVYSSAWEVVGVDFEKMISLGFGYTFSEGDVMMLINSAQEKFYLEVVGTQGNFILLQPEDIGDTSTATFYFELKTPTQDNGKTYWEIGRNYKINDPGEPTRTFSVLTDVIYGDTYFGKRLVFNTNQPVQCMNPNNKVWTEWPQDTGRPSMLLFSKEKRFETEVAWSSTYFPGTETNQLNQFVSGDIRTLDSGLGQIQILKLTSRTQDYGTVMLAVGQTEVASMYLGRTEFYNAAETPSLINTVDVIGTINILRGGFGTLNPESFVENDGDAYWFSAIKSAFTRYSKAGVEPVSDRKFSSFAAWLGNAIMLAASDVPGISPIKIPAGYDEFNKEAVWSIPPIGTWPISYPVLDVEESVTATESSPVGSVTAALVAGSIYRFMFTAPGPTQIQVTCDDLFHGPKTFISVGTLVSFVFVAASTGNYTFNVVTVPTLSTVVHTFTITKLRINPYTTINLFPKTVVFSEEKGRFSWFMNAVPEWWGRAGDKLFCMKLGNLFSLDSVSTNNFFGVRFPSWAAMAFNQAPSEVKRLQGTSMETTGAPAYAHFRTEDDFVQSSDLVAADFRKQEGIWSASAYRDRLSPNTSGTVVDKLLKGDEMRGRSFKVLYEWSSLTTFVAKILNIIYRSSTGNKT